MAYNPVLTLPGVSPRVQLPSSYPPERNVRLAATTGLATAGIAFLAFLALNRLLLVYPGTLVTEHNDVIFGTDIGDRWKELSGQCLLRASVSHPMLHSLWGRLGRGFAEVLLLALPAKEAALYAAACMVSLMAALGVGCIVAIALRFANRKINVVLLIPVCLLFTANVLIIVPDHLGLSFGLFAASSITLLPDVSFRKQLLILLVFGFLLAVTTVTNALFAFVVGIVLSWGQPLHRFVYRWRLMLSAAAIAVLSAGTFVGIWRWEQFKHADTIIHRFITFRLVQDPLAAARYSGYGLVFPAVGPRPIVNITRDLGTPDDHISLAYNGSGISDYSSLGRVAAMVWVVLLAVSVIHVSRKPVLRRYLAVLLIWIVFNLVFHNVWGDEFFFYSAHWSWALMLIALLGSDGIPTWALAAAVGLLLPGQIEALYTIRTLLFGSILT